MSIVDSNSYTITVSVTANSSDTVMVWVLLWVLNGLDSALAAQVGAVVFGAVLYQEPWSQLLTVH